MGWYCYTVISCGANDAEVAKSVASKHLAAFPADYNGNHIARGFLRHVAEGKAYAEAWKGSAITYGAVGNYIRIDEVVEQLLPFFDELWDMDGRGGLMEFDHAIVLVNQEQSMKTEVREIVSKQHVDDEECTRPEDKGKRVREYTAPWSWHQM